MTVTEVTCQTRSLELNLNFLQASVQAFQRHRLRRDVLDALFIFSQLALQSPATSLVSVDLNTKTSGV